MKRYLYKVLSFLTLFAAVIVTLAAVLPYNKDGYLREQAVKMAMIDDASRKPAIVILGGSNVAFGYDSKVLEEKTGMTVINAGLHAGLGLRFIMADCLPRLKKGDILVFSPEYEHFFSHYCDGQGELADMFFLNGMTLPGKMSGGQWRTIIDNTPAWLKRKVEYNIFELAHLKTDPVYRLSSFNKYGDVTWHWYNNRPHGTPKGAGKSEEVKDFNEEFFVEVVSALKEVQTKGVNVILFPPAIEKNAYIDKKLKIEYISTLLSRAGFPFVCATDHDAFTKDKFYDTVYHLNHEGAKMHAETLAECIVKH